MRRACLGTIIDKFANLVGRCKTKNPRDTIPTHEHGETTSIDMHTTMREMQKRQDAVEVSRVSAST